MIEKNDIRVVALAGGVGGARLAQGLVNILSPDQLSIVVNTGDDFEHYGLTICPDLDTVTYTLAGLANPGTGWGIEGDTFTCLEAIQRLGNPTWFHLGDRDLATHLVRSQSIEPGETVDRSHPNHMHPPGGQARRAAHVRHTLTHVGAYQPG